MKHRKTSIHVALLIWGICAALGLVLLSSQVHAKLPPRPTKTPTPEREPPAGTLLLNVSPTQSGLWSVVQWQGSAGNWHDVEGWRGNVEDGQTIWWVEEGHWGTGPFRWVVYQEQDGYLLATSQPFFLPGSGETLVVNISLSGR